MKNNNNFAETLEINLNEKKEKKSYKKLILGVLLLIITFGVVIALTIGINIAKLGDF